MPTSDVTDWMDEQARPGVIWFLKRLSGNDTQANGSHQAGPYIPKELLFDLFPALNRPDVHNPDIHFRLVIDSHTDVREVRAIWYNNSLFGGTRNETRVTGFGGSSSPLLGPESTGALTVFAFWAEECNVWVCSHGTEEDIIEERVGFHVEPGQGRVWRIDDPNPRFDIRRATNCWLQANDIPQDWLSSFPSGEEIIQKALELHQGTTQNVDRRLISRDVCEYEIFQSIEEAVELPIVQNGFESLNEFIARAQTILQRRKSRAGRSLELHVKAIFLEENLVEGHDFEWNTESESNKRPDFLFPSAEAYRNPDFPVSSLRMLAIKRTVRDRWRQILNEADRIETKHLLTLQHGVSENQFREMLNAGVKLVVPRPLHNMYPPTVRPHLQEFESFLADIRLLG